MDSDLRDKLGGFNAEFQASDWQQMEALLNRKRRKGIIIWFLLGVLLLSGGIAAYTLMQFEPSTAESANQVAENHQLQEGTQSHEGYSTDESNKKGKSSADGSLVEQNGGSNQMNESKGFQEGVQENKGGMYTNGELRSGVFDGTDPSRGKPIAATSGITESESSNAQNGAEQASIGRANKNKRATKQNSGAQPVQRNGENSRHQTVNANLSSSEATNESSPVQHESKNRYSTSTQVPSAGTKASNQGGEASVLAASLNLNKTAWSAHSAQGKEKKSSAFVESTTASTESHSGVIQLLELLPIFPFGIAELLQVAAMSPELLEPLDFENEDKQFKTRRSSWWLGGQVSPSIGAIEGAWSSVPSVSTGFMVEFRPVERFALQSGFDFGFTALSQNLGKCGLAVNANAQAECKRELRQIALAVPISVRWSFAEFGRSALILSAGSSIGIQLREQVDYMTDLTNANWLDTGGMPIIVLDPTVDEYAAQAINVANEESNNDSRIFIAIQASLAYRLNLNGSTQFEIGPEYRLNLRSDYWDNSNPQFIGIKANMLFKAGR